MTQQSEGRRTRGGGACCGTRSPVDDALGRAGRRPRRRPVRRRGETRRAQISARTGSRRRPRSRAGGPSCASIATRCRSSCSSRASSACSCPHQLETAIVLIVLTLLNAAMGLNQEGKASASVAALQKMMVVKAKVRRGGELHEIPMEELVPGDIVNIEAGDLVPADGRIIRAATLEIDESALTGESAPVPKQVEPVARGRRPRRPGGPGVHEHPGDPRRRQPSSRSPPGCRPRSVTSAGMLSGREGREDAADDPAREADDPAAADRGRRAGGLDRARARRATSPFETLFLTAVAFSVSAIPSGLPAVVTAILSNGTQTLAAAGAIVKRLRSVETLGSTSAINSDKTGTLTLNQMTAVQMAVVGRRYAISGEGYSTDRPDHPRGRPAATCRSTATCCRWPCAPTPWSRTASSSATRPRAR